MKTVFRIAILLVVALGVSAVSTFAQTAPAPCPPELQQKLFTDFKEKVKSSDPATIRAGVAAGKEFLDKCAEGQDKVAEFIRTKSPGHLERADKLERYQCFDGAVADRKAYKADEAFRCGKQIIAAEPNLAYDVGIVLAMVGLEESLKTPPVDKNNAETIDLAKKVIADASTAKSTGYGAKAFNCAIKTGTAVDDAKSKNCVLGRMNYIIGSIMYYNQKNEKDALAYLYKASQIDSDTKKRPDIYDAIGTWYFKEIYKMNTKYDELIKASNNEVTEESSALMATMKGYAERGINALVKAHNLASAPTQADYKKSIYTKLQGLYQIRFEKSEGLTEHLNTVANQPLIDPATPVTPVVEAPTTTDSSTTGATTTPPTTGNSTKPGTTVPNSKPSTTMPNNSKPATTNPPTKPAPTTPTKPAGKVTGKVNKAPVTKKKGTR